MAQEYSNEELISKARQGDLLAKDQLFEQNKNFSYSIANKFKTTGIEFEELVSLANLGMVKAFNTFDGSKGFKFTTYASMCMTNSILMEFRSFKRKFGKEFISLDDICYENRDGNTLTYKDIIADDSPQPDEIVESNDEIACLREALNKLSSRDREIMELYYIKGKSMVQVAEILGISQSYVSRIVTKKLKELRNIMETIRLPEPEKKKVGRPRKHPIVERTEPKRSYTRREKPVELTNEEKAKLVALPTAPILEMKPDTYDSIPDIKKYTNGMRKSILDKLWFMDKIGDAPHNIIDYGCADGSLMKEIHHIDSHHALYGYDNNLDMLKLARENFPEGSYFNNWRELINNIEHNSPENCVLNISSLIHEVYSYCTEPTIKEFWDDVFNSAPFEYISIRDMSLSQTSLRVAPVEDVAKIYHYANKELLADFEAKWGSIYYLPNMIHWLLKYRYALNWQREVKENYLPLTVEDLFRIIPMDRYKIVHFEHYTLPFLKDIVKKDFDIELKESTHVKILLQRR